MGGTLTKMEPGNEDKQSQHYGGAFDPRSPSIKIPRTPISRVQPGPSTLFDPRSPVAPGATFKRTPLPKSREMGPVFLDPRSPVPPTAGFSRTPVPLHPAKPLFDLDPRSPREARTPIPNAAEPKALFDPRSPMEGRTPLPTSAEDKTVFDPRSPMEGRTPLPVVAEEKPVFDPRSPMEGRTPLPKVAEQDEAKEDVVDLPVSVPDDVGQMLEEASKSANLTADRLQNASPLRHGDDAQKAERRASSQKAQVPQKLFGEDADEVANVLRTLGDIKQQASPRGHRRKKSTTLSKDNAENEFDFSSLVAPDSPASPKGKRRGSSNSRGNYRVSLGNDEGFDKQKALLMFNTNSTASFGLVSNLASPVHTPTSPRKVFGRLSMNNSPVPEVVQMTNM